MVAANAVAIEPVAEEPGPIQHRKVPPSSDFAHLLREVTRTTGKTYFAQVQELVRLASGPGRIGPFEFFLYRLFDDAIPAERKAAFVGRGLRGQLINKHFDPAVFDVGLDKLSFYARALELGLPAPRVLAVCHAERTFPGARALRGTDDLLAFLRDPSVYPLFGKPNSMSASVGVASMTRLHAGDDEIEMSDGRRFPVDRMAEELKRYFAEGYLLQTRLHPHPEIRAVSGDTLSTIRMMVLDLGDGPKVIRASWRVPVGENQADVAWRGNIMAAIDPATGVCERAGQGRGLERQSLDSHPDSGRPIVGMTLPDWAAACELAVSAAAKFPDLPLVGWDMALTDRGPVLIELEPDGGDPSVTQIASGVGLLDGPYAQFVEQVRKRGKFKPKRR